ncbi:nucleotide-diphospho-sugar transferase [Coniella lustricola]|uniref:Nucleotide-diphospho-sugar transferase n=1 Tax=Coniella lustricola TaxID=2025994 RepID=A0A2T3AB40_9PEZI|nr:nucleotide-diphospho-sugar transferase [Coniella lustricola]
MVSRLGRIFLAALATALILYYHSTILTLSGLKYEASGDSTTYIEVPIPVHVPASSDGVAGPDHSGGGSNFNEDKYPFQEDLVEYRQPRIDVAQLKKYAPHHDQGAGQEAYATYLSTRNNSIYDPYFLSAQQLIHRLLWAPKSRSTSYPIVIFVAPFIPQEQRDILLAQGAIVRELELVPWDPPPSEDGSVFPFGRWKDLFSKLNIWGQTDFSRILFLDLDAFPVQNIDGIFDANISPRQRCRADLLPPEDQAHTAEICDYVFAGQGPTEEINVGAIVLEPNVYMHQRLLRESQDTSKFDNKMAEQAFLNYAFGPDGPFPASFFGREYNGNFPQEDEEGLLRIVHEKLWSLGDGSPSWTKNIYREGWDELLTLYESPQFEELREQDGLSTSI